MSREIMRTGWHSEFMTFSSLISPPKIITMARDTSFLFEIFSLRLSRCVCFFSLHKNSVVYILFFILVTPTLLSPLLTTNFKRKQTLDDNTMDCVVLFCLDRPSPNSILFLLTIGFNSSDGSGFHVSALNGVSIIDPTLMGLGLRIVGMCYYCI